MRTALKMVLPLIVSVAVVSGLFAWYQVRTERRILRSDLSRRAEILGEALQESVEPLMDRAPDRNLQRLVERFSDREHLKGVAVYDAAGKTSGDHAGNCGGVPELAGSCEERGRKESGTGRICRRKAHRSNPEKKKSWRCTFWRARCTGTTSWRERSRCSMTRATSTCRLQHTLRDSLVNALVQTLLITGLALILVRWTFMRPLKRTAHWLRTLRTGGANGAKAPPGLPQGQGEIFDQLHQEVTHLAHDLSTARATAEEEARLRDTGASLWTAERLRVSLQDKLHGTPLFVVSNREPYMHVLNEKDKIDQRHCPGERPGDGARAGVAGVQRDVGGQRVGQRRIARSWTPMTDCACRRIIQATRCGACG